MSEIVQGAYIDHFDMDNSGTVTRHMVQDSGAVRFDAPQTLTDAQKAQARENIGGADAGEVSDLKSAVNNSVFGVTSPTSDIIEFRQGAFNRDSGNYIDTDYAIRTHTFIPSHVIGISCSASYKFVLWAWSASDNTFIGHIQSDGTYGSDATYLFMTRHILDWNKGYKYKITFYNADNSAILPSAGTNCFFSLPTDDTLSLQNKAADAYATGQRLLSLSKDYDAIIGDFNPIYQPVSGTLISDKYIDKNEAITDLNTYQLLKIELDSTKKYYVTARAYKNTYYYTFSNANDVVIGGGLKSTSDGTTTISRVEIVPPAGAHYLYIASPINANVQKAEIITRYTTHYVWAGKKWCVVGDSLTEDNIRTTTHYFDYVAEKTGISIYNLGDSGTGYARGQDTSSAFYQRISQTPLDSDVVTIFGSFNDLGAGLNLGTADDSGTTTIGGCVNATLDALFTRLPLANVGVVTPTPWENQNPTNEPNTASAYVDLIIAVCKKRGIPCLDLFHCSLLRPWESAFRALAYSKDDGNGVHPDETGHLLIAPRFEGFLNDLLLQ